MKIGKIIVVVLIGLFLLFQLYVLITSFISPSILPEEKDTDPAYFDNLQYEDWYSLGYGDGYKKGYEDGLNAIYEELSDGKED